MRKEVILGYFVISVLNMREFWWEMTAGESVVEWRHLKKYLIFLYNDHDGPYSYIWNVFSFSDFGREEANDKEWIVLSFAISENINQNLNWKFFPPHSIF